MRPRDLVPLLFIGGIVAFIVAQSVKTPRRPRPARVERDTAAAPMSPRRVASQGPRSQTDTLADTLTDTLSDTLPAAPPEPNPLEGMVEVRMSTRPTPTRDDESIRNTIEAYAERTYLDAMLKQQERLLMRWPARELNAVRVYIDRFPEAQGWDSNYLAVAERAFDEWREAGFPVSFDFVHDSASANIHIVWTTQLAAGEERRIGTTMKTRDQHGWIVAAEITVSLKDPQGRFLSPALVAGILRHEVGHALGLGHSENAADVMYPESRTPTISAADRTTLSVLYRLPPGVVK